jgi:hypothetical protein
VKELKIQRKLQDFFQPNVENAKLLSVCEIELTSAEAQFLETPCALAIRPLRWSYLVKLYYITKFSVPEIYIEMREVRFTSENPTRTVMEKLY